MSEKNDWGTPQAFFNELDAEFHFRLDACANANNHKCTLYIDEKADGLACSWYPGPVFCNPPYDNWQQWVRKATDEARQGVVVVLLLAARTDTRAFHDYFWDRKNHQPYRGIQVRFVRGRLKFEGALASAPFPSMVVVINFNCK